MDTLPHYTTCFSNLRRGVTKFGPAPHKLILLLAVIEGIDQGSITQNRIDCSDALVERFLSWWKNYVTTDNVPNIALPFFHLEREGFWHLHPFPGKAQWLEQQESIGSLGVLRSSILYASLDDDLYQLLTDAHARMTLRNVLINELHKTGYGTLQKPCPFCHVQSDRILAENDLAQAFYDGFPVSHGHTLIVPRRHEADYFLLHSDEVSAIHDLIILSKALLDNQFHPNGFNLGVNVGEPAGQSIFHCHIHLIPRYTGDVPNPRGGVRGVIPAKQNY